MSNYYEDREAAPEGDRERDLFNRLPQALEQARARAPAIEQQLQGIHLHIKTFVFGCNQCIY